MTAGRNVGKDGWWFWSEELPPSDNKRLIFTRGQRRLVPDPRAKAFERQMGEAWRELIHRADTPFPLDPLFRAWVVVAVTVILPDRRRRDATNLLKVPIDALVRAGVLEDDCRVLGQVRAVFYYDDPRGLARTLWPWQGKGCAGGMLIEVERAEQDARPFEIRE